MKTVYAICNPAATHSRRAVAALKQSCRAARLAEPKVFYTTVDDPGRNQARAAIEAGANLVVAIGGDGTIRQVAAALVGSDVRLAVLPTGSGNVLAANIGLSRHALEDAAQIALYGSMIHADLGWAEFNGQTEPFITMAGVGRDAQTVKATSALLKRLFGALAYGASGLAHAVAPPISMRIKIDDQAPIQVDSWTLLAGNVNRVPGGITVFPDGELDDGKLQLLQVPLQHPLQWIPIALRGFGNQRVSTCLRYDVAERVQVELAHPSALQLDGDVFAAISSVKFFVQPKAIRLAVG